MQARIVYVIWIVYYWATPINSRKEYQQKYNLYSRVYAKWKRTQIIDIEYTTDTE